MRVRENGNHNDGDSIDVSCVNDLDKMIIIPQVVVAAPQISIIDGEPGPFWLRAVNCRLRDMSL